MVEQNLDIETTRNEDHYGAAIHHLSLLRNKRCLMAYMYKSNNLQMRKFLFLCFMLVECA
jgi:GINS complex subunit 1